jgi:hypothetical protein
VTAGAGYLVYLLSGLQAPTYQYSIDVRDSTPQWRLCDANIGYYDDLTLPAPLTVEVTTTSYSESAYNGKGPHLQLAYNYEYVDNFQNSKTSDCECKAILPLNNKPTNKLTSSFNLTTLSSNSGGSGSILSYYFPQSSLQLCAAYGGNFLAYGSTSYGLQNFQPGMAGTLLMDPKYPSPAIIYIGNSMIPVNPGESKIVHLQMTTIIALSSSSSFQLELISDQSMGTHFGCVPQYNSNGDLVPNAYEISFNVSGSVPCVRIIPESKVIYITDGANGLLIFTSFIAFFGSAASVVISVFGLIVQCLRHRKEQQLEASMK